MKRIFISFLASVMMLALGSEALSQQDRNRNRGEQNQRRSEQAGPNRTAQDRRQRSVDPARTTNRGNNQGQVRQTQGNRGQRNVQQPNQIPHRAGNRGQVEQNNRGNDRIRQQPQRNNGPVYGARTQGRERYNRPRPGFMPLPRHGLGYMYPRYSRFYSRSRLIFFAQIPLIIYQNSLYRNCRYENKAFTNLSGYPAQVLINDWPYPLANGGYILYPGQSVWIPVPTCASYDIDASILINGVWYRVLVYRDDSLNYVISDEPY